MMTHGTPRRRRAALSTLVCVLGLGLAPMAEAAPRQESLVGLDGGLSGEAPAAAPASDHSCDALWQQLSTPPASWSAEVSLSQAYQLAGVSSLAPVQEDPLGRYAVRAPLYQAGEPGVVEVRFGRAGDGSQFRVWVTTCNAAGVCRDTALETQRLNCSTRRDHATLTVRDVGPHQKVVVSFSR